MTTPLAPQSPPDSAPTTPAAPGTAGDGESTGPAGSSGAADAADAAKAAAGAPSSSAPRAPFPTAPAPTGLAASLKPRLRGWIHAGTAPLALAACIVLTALAPSAALSWASAVYLTCSLLLFANSGVYHIGNGHWSARVTSVLRRIDHANIYLLIAGTYTPLSVALLPGPTAALVLGIVWAGAAIGTVTNLLWMSAPRWFTAGLYVVLGWVAIWFLPQFWRSGGPAIVWLLVAGGIIYTLGAVVYARKAPDPSPRWFGFHEVFHVCTVAAWACQCVACYLAIL